MSRKGRIEHQIKQYRETCLSRLEPDSEEDVDTSRLCVHAPGNNMVWGSPPELFCPQCIHYQRGHVDPHEEEEE